MPNSRLLDSGDAHFGDWSAFLTQPRAFTNRRVSKNKSVSIAFITLGGHSKPAIAGHLKTGQRK